MLRIIIFENYFLFYRAKKRKAVLAIVLFCFSAISFKSLPEEMVDSAILQEAKLQRKELLENTEYKPNICVDHISVEWIFYKRHTDLRNASVFQDINVEQANFYRHLTSDKWLLCSCETAKNNAANGLNREWKGDIPGNINANIFIPASVVVGGDAKLLHLLLHRIVPLAIYTVIQREVIANGGKAESVQLKWVNDILVNGKKISGIKSDDFGSTDKVVSFQFGVNVNMPEEELAKIDQPATSLSNEFNRPIDHEEILRKIVVEIIKLTIKYKDDLPGLDNEFSSHMAYVGDEVIVYNYVPGKNIEGILEKVAGGKLYVKNPKTGEVTEILPGFGLLRLKNRIESSHPHSCTTCEYSQRVKEVLKNITKDDILKVQAISTKHSGPVVFTAETSQKKYAIKFCGSSAAFDKEEYFAGIASDVGFDPKLFYADKSSKALIMDFLSPVLVTLLQMQDQNFRNRFYQQLADMLRKLHNVNSTKPLEEMNLSHKIEFWFDKLKKMKKLNPDLEKRLDLAKRIAMDFKSAHLNNALCHCDLHTANLIYTAKGFFVIDYELTSRFDPLYDIASVLICWCLSKEDENIFLNYYFGRNISQHEKEKIGAFKKIVMLEYAIVTLIKCSCGTEIKLVDVNVSSPLELAKEYGFPILAHTDKQRLELASIMLKLIIGDDGEKIELLRK